MLTAREREILQLLADGMSNADVAARLFISQETVKSHVRHILAKLEADTRTHAVAIALARRDHRLMADEVPADERERLVERIITAEQDERRRLALFLHDGPVQSLAGIALMLDAAVQSIDEGKPEVARGIMASALERHRETIRSLRDLSFNIEPVVLRDRGFGAAVQELANQLGMEHKVRIEVDVELASQLGEKEQVGLYQIVRESLNQAVRRGPPSKISVRIHDTPEGEIETVVSDNGTGERRTAALDAIGERASTLNGRFSVEQGSDGHVDPCRVPFVHRPPVATKIRRR